MKVYNVNTDTWQETKPNLPTVKEVLAQLDVVDCRVIVHGEGYIELSRDFSDTEKAKLAALVASKR